MTAYIALIRKEAGTSYGVDFPDFPGLVSGGETLDQARANAQEGLGFHIAGMVEDGTVIPHPSSLQKVMKDLHNRDAVAVLVEPAAPKVTFARLNITMDEALVARMDAVTSNRSAYIDAAVRESLSAGTMSPGAKKWAEFGRSAHRLAPQSLAQIEADRKMLVEALTPKRRSSKVSK